MRLIKAEEQETRAVIVTSDQCSAPSSICEDGAAFKAVALLIGQCSRTYEERCVRPIFKVAEAGRLTCSSACKLSQAARYKHVDPLKQLSLLAHTQSDLPAACLRTSLDLLCRPDSC